MLGNHDYGDGAKAGTPPPECPPPMPRSACFPSPLHQVRQAVSGLGLMLDG